MHLMPRITSELVEMTRDLRRWLEDEYRATMADHRKKLCASTDRLEIRMPIILCESCFGAKVEGIFVHYRGPDVLQRVGNQISLTSWMKMSQARLRGRGFAAMSIVPPQPAREASVCRNG